MGLNYTDFENGDGLLDIRNKINTFNNSVVNEVSNLEAKDTEQDVSIQELQEVSTSYNYNKVSGISTTSSTYSVANSLLVEDAPEGVYEYKFIMTYNHSTTTKSAYFRFSLDGGTTWNEVRKEVKDVTDNIPVYYGFPVVHPGGDIDLVIEYRTEVDGNVLNVSFIDIVVERKL